MRENREQKFGIQMSKLQCQRGFENWSCVTIFFIYIPKDQCDRRTLAKSNGKVFNALKILFSETLWQQSCNKCDLGKRKREVAAAGVPPSSSLRHISLTTVLSSLLQETPREEMTMAKLTESMSE